jgi:hypothetical protein
MACVLATLSAASTTANVDPRIMQMPSHQNAQMIERVRGPPRKCCIIELF